MIEIIKHTRTIMSTKREPALKGCLNGAVWTSGYLIEQLYTQLAVLLSELHVPKARKTIWQYGNLSIWQYGNLSIRQYGNLSMRDVLVMVSLSISTQDHRNGTAVNGPVVGESKQQSTRKLPFNRRHIINIFIPNASCKDSILPFIVSVHLEREQFVQ